MDLSRRQLGQALAASFSILLLPRAAEGTTVVALQTSDLLSRSRKVALVTPSSSTSAWESLGGQRRIVTRTRALIHELWRSTDDDTSNDEEEAQELQLQTLGGRVGDVQQRVFGEARLDPDKPCLVFAGPRRMGARRIVGMAQGHYPLEEKDGAYHLRQSPGLPPMMRKPQKVQTAVEELSDLEINRARTLLRGQR